jgi:hypothetical protein
LHLLFSALFILSDHGSRDSEVRKTRQGQLEDRLPLAYVILPQWFSQKYPQAVKNLRGNAKHITSAYDMYETFKDLTDLSKLNDQHIHYIRQRKLKVAEKVYESRIGCSLYNFDFFLLAERSSSWNKLIHTVARASWLCQRRNSTSLVHLLQEEEDFHQIP